MERLGIDWTRLAHAWVTPWDETAAGLDTPTVAMGAILIIMTLEWLAYSWGERRRRRTRR